MNYIHISKLDQAIENLNVLLFYDSLSVIKKIVTQIYYKKSECMCIGRTQQDIALENGRKSNTAMPINT